MLCFLRNISAKNYQNWLLYSEVIVSFLGNSVYDGKQHDFNNHTHNQVGWLASNGAFNNTHNQFILSTAVKAWSLKSNSFA